VLVIYRINHPSGTAVYELVLKDKAGRKLIAANAYIDTISSDSMRQALKVSEKIARLLDELNRL
jgi:hypothetical protein